MADVRRLMDDVRSKNEEEFVIAYMKKLCVFVSLCSIIALVGCAADDALNTPNGQTETFDPVGQPVLFAAGSLTESLTRAGEPLGSTAPFHLGMTSTTGVPYMPENGRFVCTMYYHAASGDTDASPFDIKDKEEGGTMKTAWLKVNNSMGNSVYRKMDFDETSMNLDDYNFDKNSTIFFWQNRLTHAFLALADYNKLTTNTGATTRVDNEGNLTSQGKLKMYPYGDKETTITVGEGDEAVSTSYYDTNVYDLTRGTKTAMTDQPDPILALTIMKPAGATQEANRVELYFRHQFSQIQVNVKCDESANIQPNQIEGVELLGISTEAYVYNHMKADGTLEPAKAKDVNVNEYPDAVLNQNPYATSFQMFDMGDGNYPSGYLKSFNAIAFGMLRAIRIAWHEGTTSEPGIQHVSTFEVINAVAPTGDDGQPVDLINLKSGLKYVYNLELRRGTLAIIRAEIKDWLQKTDLVYGADGTISN